MAGGQDGQARKAHSRAKGYFLKNRVRILSEEALAAEVEALIKEFITQATENQYRDRKETENGEGRG